MRHQFQGAIRGVEVDFEIHRAADLLNPIEFEHHTRSTDVLGHTFFAAGKPDWQGQGLTRGVAVFRKHGVSVPPCGSNCMGLYSGFYGYGLLGNEHGL